MDIMLQGVISLLKSAITGCRIDLPEGFDIEEVYPRIKAHHMATLIYSGAVNCGIDQNKPVMQQLFQTYCKALQISERQMQELNRLFAAFDERKIDYLPLKGCIMKGMYPKPELRMMGDADILIRTEQYERIEPIMKELGFAGGGEEAERVVVWKSKALCLELHKCLIAPKYPKYHAYFREGWSFAQVQNGTRYAMSTEDTFVFMFTHFSKHYASAGIGCRHVVDLWVYLRNHPVMDEEYLKKALGKVDLWKFYQNIRKLIDVWFEGAASDEKTEFISQMVFSNGSWGNTLNGALYEGIKDMKATGSVAKSRLKYIQRRIFPGMAVFQGKFPVLQKKPWLLPVIWCVYLLHKMKRLQFMGRKHRKQLLMLNRSDIEQRNKMLEYVGLRVDE